MMPPSFLLQKEKTAFRSPEKSAFQYRENSAFRVTEKSPFRTSEKSPFRTPVKTSYHAQKLYQRMLIVAGIFCLATPTLVLAHQNNEIDTPVIVREEAVNLSDSVDVTNIPLDEYLNSLADPELKSLLEKYFNLPNDIITELIPFESLEEQRAYIGLKEKAIELAALPREELRAIVDEIEANIPNLRAKQKALYLESREEIVRSLHGESASVTIAKCLVVLNGQPIDNNIRKYPLLSYRDIVYFPMIWVDCRNLGISANWNREQGLDINKAEFHDGLYFAAETEPASINKNKSYKAAMVTYPVKVNGKEIDNSKEDYPLLLFRDITYFPLTWHFISEEFGWFQTFDGTLKINAEYTSAPPMPPDSKEDLMVSAQFEEEEEEDAIRTSPGWILGDLGWGPSYYARIVFSFDRHYDAKIKRNSDSFNELKCESIGIGHGTLEPEPNIITKLIQIQYQLYKFSAKGEQLVETVDFPPFEGTLKQFRTVSSAMTIPYWNQSDVPVGKYRIVYKYPEQVKYSYEGDATERILSMTDNFYSIYHQRSSFEFEIE